MLHQQDYKVKLLILILRFWLNPASAVYDMQYSKERTRLLLHCVKQGVTKISDGFGMLVGQAAHAFYLWRGIKPEIDPLFSGNDKNIKGRSNRLII